MPTLNHEQILKQAFEIYSEQFCNTLPKKAELSDITFSSEFEVKMQNLIDKNKKYYFYYFNTVGKRVAVILVALLLTLSTIVFSVKALRETIVNFIVETFEQYSHIHVETETDMEVTLEAVVGNPPEYIPDGFKLDKTEEYFTSYKLYYIRNDNEYIRFNQLDNAMNLQIDTEDIEFTEIKIGKYDGIIYTNKEKTQLYFSDKKYIYCIISNALSDEEIIKIANSVKLF